MESDYYEKRRQKEQTKWFRFKEVMKTLFILVTLIPLFLGYALITIYEYIFDKEKEEP